MDPSEQHHTCSTWHSTRGSASHRMVTPHQTKYLASLRQVTEFVEILIRHYHSERTFRISLRKDFTEHTHTQKESSTEVSRSRREQRSKADWETRCALRSRCNGTFGSHTDSFARVGECTGTTPPIGTALPRGGATIPRVELPPQIGLV